MMNKILTEWNRFLTEKTPTKPNVKTPQNQNLAKSPALPDKKKVKYDPKKIAAVQQKSIAQIKAFYDKNKSLFPNVNLSLAIKAAEHESTLNPSSVRGNRYYGLFQVSQLAIDDLKRLNQNIASSLQKKFDNLRNNPSKYVVNGIELGLRYLQFSYDRTKNAHPNDSKNFDSGVLSYIAYNLGTGRINSFFKVYNNVASQEEIENITKVIYRNTPSTKQMSAKEFLNKYAGDNIAKKYYAYILDELKNE